MSKIGTNEVSRLAVLARIGLTDDQIAALAIELGDIVSFVEQLDQVDTTDLPITSQVTGLRDVWRADVVRDPGLTRAELLANAPDQQDGYIKVKRVTAQ